MRKVLLVTMVFLALNFAADAQEKKRTNIKYYDVELLDEIGATADQKAKIAELVKEFKPKFDAVKNDASLSADDKQAKLKEVTYARGRIYYSILNAEQKAKLDVMKKEVAKNKAN